GRPPGDGVPVAQAGGPRNRQRDSGKTAGAGGRDAPAPGPARARLALAPTPARPESAQLADSPPRPPRGRRPATAAPSRRRPGRVRPPGSDPVEFPTNGGRAVKPYSVCSYSAGETYPSDECRRRVL